MSEQKNHYVLTGIKYDYDTFYNLLKINGDLDDEPYWDSAFDDIYHKDNVCVIADGSNCKYVYVGYVTQKSGEYGDMDDNGVADFPDPDKVCNWIYDVFGFSAPCRLHIFTHYR